MWTVELHCHTHLSLCSNLEPQDIVITCQQKGINAIAITDHNTITAAEELEKKAPKDLTIIVGEEITTRQGEIIGYFLKKTIPRNMSLADTINAIREQNGLIAVPHPTDQLRRHAVGRKNIRPWLRQVDIIEIFNSRNLLWWNNTQAQKLAHEFQLTSSVASDAHFKREIGRSLNIMKPWKNQQEFLENLKQASFQTQHSWLDVHLSTAWTRKWKKHPMLRNY